MYASTDFTFSRGHYIGRHMHLHISSHNTSFFPLGGVGGGRGRDVLREISIRRMSNSRTSQVSDSLPWATSSSKHQALQLEPLLYD